jgi:mutator protein MutT
MVPKTGQAVHAAIAVIERRGRYLVCRRRTGDFLGGYWEFPGGKCHHGESWAACLKREIREELGVAVAALTPYGDMRYRYRGRTIVFRVFRCRLGAGRRPRPLDAETLRWVTLGELRRLRFPPANRGLIRRLSRPLRDPPRRGKIESKTRRSD